MGRLMISAALGGAVGGTVIWAAQKGSLHLSPVNISYADLAAVMLGAVAALLAVLGIFMAGLAIWGYSQFRIFVERAATSRVTQAMNEGELKNLFEERATTFMAAEFESGKLRKLLEERVDQIILRGPEERERSGRSSENNRPS